ncbi:TIGR03086 family protein [Streptoalloteichus tenebrarius]|uniref:TIGR03086 family protein n=1 Tax=Streptoalloteichus tenebrarius (strain ATCC 17920 / DSM 40477 / JCM 4838 / CBS 697.72 / NBRC 16177 / NCIMB 11028 / NRRL B-12390 / A12253. 1 / ISP 5477) TaxID=1933 RepID=A0ABT1I4Q1_STRSD|nr:TIGR03086 family metal-binding protein [Streptoalloteichus tenebrarius]MCP2262550.1 TIGR03086 family protein [Streptoalloteichus tenebrarius]BFE98652.1 TIGR03086 family metal-binding protein [Streptoalloteichus tenebrarius]
MRDTDSTLLGHFDTAVAGFDGRLRAVPATEWGSPTPCTEWNVRQLVNHMIQGSRIYVALLRGGSSAEFMANLNQEALDGDPLTTYREAAAECRAAFLADGAFDRVVDYPFGPVPGRQLLGLYVVDAVVHTWDLARAVGLDERLDPRTVGWVLDNFEWIYHGVTESPITDSYQYYGPPTAVASPAETAQNRLLHAMGRNP